jgi:hypothetical protein
MQQLITESAPTSGQRKQAAQAAVTAIPREAGQALTIVIPVTAGKEDSLTALLADIGAHINSNTYIPFSKLGLVHFMRWVVVPKASSASPTLLAFECNHDGSREDVLLELLTVAPAGMHAIHSHCAGYDLGAPPSSDADRRTALGFLVEHAIPYCAFFVAVPGATVGQIRAEQKIRDAIEAYIGIGGNSRKNGNGDPVSLARSALALVRADPEMSTALDRADDSSEIHPLRLAAGALAAAAALPVIVPALAAIFVKERFDKQTSQVTIPDEAAVLMAREDLLVQNQLTHVVPLREGPLRALSTRVVLGAIDFLAHAFFTRGNLGGITSIHFARWVLVDEGTRLLFFSNYDGSWESYLGDFIDKAAIGLTSVWSNTQDFPKSFLLAFHGATDEERFKAWTRSHQIPTQVWYSAYPDLTVHNILENRKICAELRRGLPTRADARRWLARF